MNETVANMTQGVASMNFVPWSGWLFTILIGFVILVTLFVMFKNFRRFIYGIPVVGGLLIVYTIAKSIGFSAAEGETGPLIFMLWVVGVILTSSLVGKLIEKTSYVKKFEEAMSDGGETESIKKSNKKSN